MARTFQNTLILSCPKSGKDFYKIPKLLPSECEKLFPLGLNSDKADVMKRVKDAGAAAQVGLDEIPKKSYGDKLSAHSSDG